MTELETRVGVPVEPMFGRVSEVEVAGARGGRWSGRGSRAVVAAVIVAIVIASASVIGVVLQRDGGPLGVGARGVDRFALAVAWARDFGGRMASAPVAAGGVLLVVTTTPTSGAPTLRGLDRGSGRTRWTLPLRAVPAAPPTVSGTTAMVLLLDGELVAVNLGDGELRWQAPTGPMFDIPLPVVPVVDGDRVYVESNDGGIRAVDITTGRTSWQRTLDARALATSTITGGVVYVPTGVLGGRGVLYALDAATGAERWRATIDGPVTSRPAVIDTAVVVTTGRYELAPTGSVVVIDRDTGTIRSETAPGGALSDPVSAAHLALVASTAGTLEARDAQGQVRWRVDIGATAGPEPSAHPVLDRAPQLVTAGGVVIAAGLDLVAVDPASGTIAWRTRVNRASLPAPAADGLIVAVNRDAEALAVVDVADGRLLARRSLLDALIGVVIADRRVYQTDDWGTVEASLLRPASRVPTQLAVCGAADPPRWSPPLPKLGQTDKSRVRAVLATGANHIRGRFSGVQWLRVEPRGGMVRAGAILDPVDDFWIVVELRSNQYCPTRPSFQNGVPLRFVAVTPT